MRISKQHTSEMASELERVGATSTEAVGLGNKSISKHANKFLHDPYNNLLHGFQIFCGARGVSETTADAPSSSRSLRLSWLHTHTFILRQKTFLPGEI